VNGQAAAAVGPPRGSGELRRLGTEIGCGAGAAKAEQTDDPKQHRDAERRHQAQWDSLVLHALPESHKLTAVNGDLPRHEGENYQSRRLRRS